MTLAALSSLLLMFWFHFDVWLVCMQVTARASVRESNKTKQNKTKQNKTKQKRGFSAVSPL
eukprot:COSAG06_NODE_68120_length_239_cov_6.328571_1_plen_60_part_01